MWHPQSKEVGTELFSAAAPDPDHWLNGDVSRRPLALDPTYQPMLKRILPWRMFNLGYSVFVYSRPLFEAKSSRNLSWIAAASGTGITLLGASLIFVAIRARIHQELMTFEIVEARDALSTALKEREKLGHDLHDGAIQSLYAIQLGLTRTAEKIEVSMPEHSLVLEQTRERLNEVIAELRRFILASETLPESTAAPRLAEVLGSVVDKLRPTTSLQLNFQDTGGPGVDLTVSQTLQLAQIARSAIANALRHSWATRVDVSLQATEAELLLTISDDGRGFDPAQVPVTCVGIQAMRTRAQQAGGVLELDSRPGQGTRVTARIPANPLPRPAPN
jgi:signal transduction histidine kinase